jgi:hypothetical protein
MLNLVKSWLMTSLKILKYPDSLKKAIHLGVDDRDLISEISKSKIQCFLCGPGKTDQNYQTRESLRNYLQNNCGVEVLYGEELPGKFKKMRLPKTDLQTMESNFAQKVDFTILMLDAPGAIAELGSFAVLPRIQTHLYVLVPQRFYNSASYIARGPLDLLVRLNGFSVRYYHNDADNAFWSKLLAFPVCFHKYFNADKYWKWKYRNYFNSKEVKKPMEQFENMRRVFLPSYLASTLYILGGAQFSDIISFISINPDELNHGLRLLFDMDIIEKKNGKYYISVSSDHQVFHPFNTGKLSCKRSQLIAIEKNPGL